MKLEDLARKTAVRILDNYGYMQNEYGKNQDDEVFHSTQWIHDCIQEAVKDKDEQISELLEVMRPVSEAQQKAWDEMRLKNLPVTTIGLGLLEITRIAFKYREFATESRPPKEDKGKRAERLRRMKL